MKINKSIKILIIVIFSIFSIILGIAIGGWGDNFFQIIQIILHKIFGLELSSDIPKTMVSIIWNIRIPRVLIAFLVGGMLSVSGVIVQSILRNPLASSYTIGVSSGASLGIGIFILLETLSISFSYFVYPIAGFICSILTVIFVIYLSKKIDRNVGNNTIILIGMVISLFLSSFLTLLTSLKKESLSSILIWQLGSFSSRGWGYLLSIIPFFFIGFIGTICLSEEMDILTFGDEMSKSVGVNLKSVKIKLLILASILTGASIASSGIIGFIDLITPHISRKIFGANHKIVIPVSLIIGGSFMVLFDVISRIIIYPAELPISTINALIGTPIFCYIFFKGNRR